MLVYLDHAATAPLHLDAAEAMRPWLGGRFGNPSGAHRVARAARAAIDDAREVVATATGVEPGGVVFTSGGTEADNLAVLGAVAARPGAIVISAVEHPAVVEAALASGQEVRLAPVDGDGVVDPDRLGPLLDRDVSIVSVQLANQETGAVQPIETIARLVRRRSPGAVFHTDAVQAAPWLDLPAEASCADLISVSSHKWGGPQGVGVLAMRGAVPLRPIIHGGGQERELRSGTHNVAGIVGFGAAVAAARPERRANAARVGELRDALARRIIATTPGPAVETSAGRDRLPGHLHMRFPGVESEALLVMLDDAGVCASAGTACASGALEPSPSLLAMGVAKEEALSALRLTLGPTTSLAEVDLAASVVASAVARLRGA